MHDPEHYYSKAPKVPYTAGRINLSQADPAICGRTWPTLFNSSALGVEKYYGRDGSHHTTPDAHGWRSPTPYWGYEYKLTDSVPLGFKPQMRNSTNKSVMGNTCNVTHRASLPMSVVALKAYRPSFPDLEAQAISAALADLGSATAELGVELKEARKTADLLEETLGFFCDTVRDFRKGKIPRAWKRLKRKWRGRKAPSAAANAWLEYRYGWTPMVLGVYDAMELLEDKKTRILFTVRKRAEQDDTSTSSFEATQGGYYPFNVWETRRTGDVKSVYVVLTFEARSDLCATLNDAGVLNPASVWWETVPFSFVGDWFLDVGGYLSAQAALRLFRLKGGTATHNHEWLHDRTVTSIEKNGLVPCIPFTKTASAGGNSFNRKVLNPDDMVPTLLAGPGLNLARSADLASLAYSLLRGMEGMRKFRL